MAPTEHRKMLGDLPSFFIACGVVLAMVVAAALSLRFPWLRYAGATLLYLLLVNQVFFGFGGGRGYMQAAREEGRSADYIDGFSAMFANIHVPRRQIFVFATGLYVFTIVVFLVQPRPRKTA